MLLSGRKALAKELGGKLPNRKQTNVSAEGSLWDGNVLGSSADRAETP